ncbi:hypothetical protein CTEN210_10726 [Chaetoceros tenuissimus]|uniref:Asparagine synthetase domain-containing protein n=1 Tax=Chaetoceros tenuissimus TaxID=426638 RepID=A0AAD3D0E0_9STRA|nr:hypothetical protein CTEN210_10726 [Chaetoceros tenuissimus]
MNDQSKECRDRLCTSMEKISKQIDPRQTAIILSGGVDTCAILEAAKWIGLKFSLAITVVIGDESPDKDFAIHAASAHNLEHHVLQITADDLVNDYLPATIRLLKTWDGMTLRNSLVISAAFKEAQRLGMKEVITGDAADELFGGYSFMWGCEDDLTLWKKKRDDMCHSWTFATSQLADFYEITAHQPFMDEDFVAWALTTNRKDYRRKTNQTASSWRINHAQSRESNLKRSIRYLRELEKKGSNRIGIGCMYYFKR